MRTLLNTNSELKQFVAVSSGMSIDALLPYLSNSEAEKQIIAITGQTLYADLLTAYLENTLSTEQEALLPYVQKPLANLAVYQHIQQGGVVVSNSGVTLTTDRDKQAYQWQQVKIENSLLNQAYFALDALRVYLEANKVDFASWESESDYAQSRDYFINSPDDFSKWVDIKNNFRTLVALRPIMANIEGSLLKNTLGTDFYERLKTGIKAGDLTQDENDLINQYVQPALANLCIAEAAKKLNFDITADGAFIHSLRASSSANISEKTAPDTEQRDAFINLHEAQGKTWLSNMVDVLNASASELLYPLYFASEQYTSPEEQSTGFGVDITDDTQKIWY